MRIKFVLKSEHVLASKGAWRPTPTQSTCLYYCDVMQLVSVSWRVLYVACADSIHPAEHIWKPEVMIESGLGMPQGRGECNRLGCNRRIRAQFEAHNLIESGLRMPQGRVGCNRCNRRISHGECGNVKFARSLIKREYRIDPE